MLCCIVARISGICIVTVWPADLQRVVFVLERADLVLGLESSIELGFDVLLGPHVEVRSRGDLLVVLLDVLDLVARKLRRGLLLEQVQTDLKSHVLVIGLNYLPCVPLERPLQHPDAVPSIQRACSCGVLSSRNLVKDALLLRTCQWRRHHVPPPARNTPCCVLPRPVVPHKVLHVVGVLDCEPRVLVHVHVDKHVPRHELLSLDDPLPSHPELCDVCARNQHLLDRRLQPLAVRALGKQRGPHSVLKAGIALHNVPARGREVLNTSLLCVLNGALPHPVGAHLLEPLPVHLGRLPPRLHGPLLHAQPKRRRPPAPRAHARPMCAPSAQGGGGGEGEG
mmetsp:Transcript_6930/g.17210  ORF Transcript_6930/g.17210 Transcript_6930/m.17210 type:complete len:338 (+) Transcript_6930:491-1504(+)